MKDSCLRSSIFSTKLESHSLWTEHPLPDFLSSGLTFPQLSQPCLSESLSPPGWTSIQLLTSWLFPYPRAQHHLDSAFLLKVLPLFYPMTRLLDCRSEDPQQPQSKWAESSGHDQATISDRLPGSDPGGLPFLFLGQFHHVFISWHPAQTSSPHLLPTHF